MKKIIVTIVLVSLLFGVMSVAMVGFIPNAKAAPGDWIERIVYDMPEAVNSIAVGDVDNDGINEVVIGMDMTAFELVAFEKVGDYWSPDYIGDVGNTNVLSIAIGDADNDGFNEVVVGLESPATNELMVFKRDGIVWGSEAIANTGVSINSVAIGDVDNDSQNEVIIGMDSTAGEVRAFEKLGPVWTPDHLIDVPTDVNSIAVGDADNDMSNEIVIGMNAAAPDYEVRAFEYSPTGWEVDNITSTTSDVLSIAIGDADNDGSNDVVFGMKETSNEIRLYKKNGGWAEMFAPIPNVNADVNSVAIGDVDNDAKNEILAGLASTNGEVIAFEYDWLIADWTLEIISDTPSSVLSVTIGDADGESNNEAVIGMASTTNEVRMYYLDRGELVFVSHNDGDYVSGNERFDVFVTSNYVDSVKFYLNDVVIFQDTNDPYQFVLDTPSLIDDTTYTIKAEGLRINAPSLIDTVDVIVKNAPIVGDYISVTTLKFEYSPDQDIAAIISTKSPPTYDYVNIVVSYTDPSGNKMYAIKEHLPVATQYIVILSLSSDTELGLYDVSANAYGYTGDFPIWEATNTTTFNVSGKNLKELLDDLNSQHEILNGSIASLSEVVGNEHEFTRSEILTRINDTIDEIGNVEYTLSHHDDDVKEILDTLNGTVVNEHNMTKQELLESVAFVLTQIEDLNADVISEANDIKTVLGDSINNLDSDLAAHDTKLDGHDDSLDSAKDEAKEANERHDMYLMLTMVFLIIALVLILINLLLLNKGYKMMKDAKSGGMQEERQPEKEPVQEEIIEEDAEIEGAIDDALGDIEQPSE